MKEDIKDKLIAALSRKVTTEAELIYILVEIRKLLDYFQTTTRNEWGQPPFFRIYNRFAVTARTFFVVLFLKNRIKIGTVTIKYDGHRKSVEVDSTLLMFGLGTSVQDYFAMCYADVCCFFETTHIYDGFTEWDTNACVVTDVVRLAFHRIVKLMEFAV